MIQELSFVRYNEVSLLLSTFIGDITIHHPSAALQMRENLGWTNIKRLIKMMLKHTNLYEVGRRQYKEVSKSNSNNMSFGSQTVTVQNHRRGFVKMAIKRWCGQKLRIKRLTYKTLNHQNLHISIFVFRMTLPPFKILTPSMCQSMYDHILTTYYSSI